MAPGARPLQPLLAEKLADSLAATLPDRTPRRVFGAVSLPGKATAVVGVRRAGKTCFLHQLRRTRLEQGAARDRLPYVSFEDERLAGLTAADLHPMIEEYYRRYPEARAGTRLLTLMRDQAPSEVPPGIAVQPAYEWMLAAPETRE